MVAAAIFNVGMNALAGAGILFDTQTGAVSDSVQTGVTPAGWAFSIWSLIFVGVLVFAAWQARPAARQARYDALALPFIAANLLNGLWQVPWLMRLFGVAAVVIVGILASLAVLYVRLDRMPLRGPERWALGVPVSLFLAWLTVATPLNLTVAFSAAGWTDPGPLWPVLLLLVVGAVGAWLLSRTADVAIAGVLVWAFVAVWAKNGGAELTVGLVLGAVLFLGGLVAGLRRGLSPWPTAHAEAR